MSAHALLATIVINAECSVEIADTHNGGLR